MDTVNKLSGRQSLKIAENGRYIEHIDGTPFFYLGDTAWELFHRLNRQEAISYLEDRASKGFSIIQAVAIAEINGLTEPNAYGLLPLIDNDPSRPNESYFEHVDFIIDYAGRLGLYIGFLPTWGKYWKTGNSNIFTPETARAYGQFLGKRYRTKSIIWILGGDQNVVTKEERSIIDALAGGLREGDSGKHLITFHPRGPGQSSRQLHDAAWLDFHMSQSSHAAYDHDTGLYAEYDLGLTPIRPTLDGEPRYECIPVGFYLRDHDRIKRFDDYDSRQAGWWSVMAGACGHSYGNNNIWQMWQPGREPVISANIPWYEALHHPGARQMGIMRRFMEAHAFHTLIPDQTIIFDGAKSGSSKIRAMRAVNDSKIIVYTPRGESFTLDQSTVKAAYVSQSWFDPRYGVNYEFRLSPRAWDGQTFQTYAPPTSGRGQDWILVIQKVNQESDIPTPFGN
ncbi:glycoside hydrolase family 140 protein [Paenibacillus sp. P36]|uniref:glycoside hydrolase family 140 protein n=1 Tax=Paenibacillus sp. P36 TaxID=3342538 RepID=UPI0038B2FBFD